MDGPTAKRKVTVGKLTPSYSTVSPATSRPSSRNSTRLPSRPVSPTKSFVSASSPLASTTLTTTTRPKAKVNSSAIRRTPSSTTDSPTYPARPSSPHKFISRRDGTLSPPSSTVGVGTRSKPVVRVKASSSISSVTSSRAGKTAKSPSPELRARSLTASSDTLRSNSAVDARKRQGSAAATTLHHTWSQSNPQALPTNVPPLPTGSVRAPRLPQSELGGTTGGVKSLNGAGSPAPQSIKIRSKVTIAAKNLNDVSNSPTPEFSTPPLPSPTTSTSGVNRPVTARVRAGSVSSSVSSPSAPPTSPPNLPAYPITTAVPAANPHRYTTTRASASGLRSSFSASSSPIYNPPSSSDEFKPFAKTSIFPPSPDSTNGTNGLNRISYGSYGRSATGSFPSAPSSAYVDPANVPLPPQSPPISSLSVSSRSSYGGNATYESGTSPESSVVSARGSAVGLGVKKKRDSSPQSLRVTLDNLVVYASSREDDDLTNGSFDHGLTAEEDEEKKVRAEAKSNRKIADLEITNHSLLAINASLEKTKDRQAKEIRELKRKLRETRLILPPRAYRAVKSSLDPNEIGDDEEDVDSDCSSDEDDEEFHSADEGVNGANGSKGESDEIYRRIKHIIENLLEMGKKALEKTQEDFIDAKGGAKVLTAEEVESWRDSGAGSSTIGRLSDSESHLDILDDDDASSFGRLTRSHSPTPQPTTRNGSVLRHSNLIPTSFSSSTTLLASTKPPPILITETP